MTLTSNFLITAMLLTMVTTAFCNMAGDYYDRAYAKQGKGD